MTDTMYDEGESLIPQSKTLARTTESGARIYDFMDDKGDQVRLIADRVADGHVAVLFFEPRDVSEVSGEPNFDYGLVIREDEEGLFFSSVFDLWPRKGKNPLRTATFDGRVSPSDEVSDLVLGNPSG